MKLDIREQCVHYYKGMEEPHSTWLYTNRKGEDCMYRACQSCMDKRQKEVIDGEEQQQD